MKKLLSILVSVFFAAIVFAQAPEKMSYQSVIRNNDNQLVTNQQVGMQISILHGSIDGTASYVETQNPTTNANGLVSIEIGNGTTVSGSFSNIDWSSGLYFIKTETDPSGGTNYTITGTSQLLSVPFALQSNSAEKLNSGFSGDYFNLTGKPFTYDNNSNVQNVFYNEGNTLRFGQSKWEYQPYNYQIVVANDSINKLPGGILIVGHDTTTTGGFTKVPLEIIGEIKNVTYGYEPSNSLGRLIKLRREDKNEGAVVPKNIFIGITKYDELFIGESALDNRIIFDGSRLGIGVERPKTLFNLGSGELYIENGGTPDTQSGIILKTPDNTKCYKLTIDNSGNLITTLIDCPE